MPRSCIIFFMKKIVSLNLCFVLLLLCGCSGNKENTDTRFMLDTVVTLTANCDDKTLDGAFELCKEYEKMLSRSVNSSDVFMLNNADDFIEVDEHTKNLSKHTKL